MTLLAAIVVALLLIIAAFHAYWGFGGVWPGHDAKSCARMVAGSPGIQSMPPPAACFAVTGALAAAAVIVLAQGGLADPGVPGALLNIAAVGVMLVFLGRGLAGYLPAWRRLWPEEPFATLDRRLYSPLCLAIGAGVALLVLKGT